MADLILHESVLCFGTEGYPMGDHKYDIRYPGWAGQSSGIHIGIGFDIGASKLDRKQLWNMLSGIGVPAKMIEALYCAIDIQGIEAKNVLERERLVEKVRITQQQALDITILAKAETGDVVKRSFPSSYNKLHPAIIEAIVKLAFGGPAYISGFSKYPGLGPLFDKELSSRNHLQQCDFFNTEMMPHYINHPGTPATYKNMAKGMLFFIREVQKILSSGNKVVIQKGPIDFNELLSDKNETLKMAAKVSNNSNPNAGLNPDTIIGWMKNAAQKEKNDLPLFCQKIGCEVPNLDGKTILTEKKILEYKTIRKGSSFDILEAQQKLVELGCYDRAGISGGMANADGAFGNNTAKAIKQFQKENNLQESGQLDNKTKELLFNMKNSNSLSDTFNEIKENIFNLFNNEDKPEPAPEPKPELNSDYKNIFQKAFQSGKGSITASVGVGGTNKPEDVATVKGLLSKLGYINLSFTEMIGISWSSVNYSTADDELNNSIKKFQKDNNLAYQDGRVDPGGVTLAVLNGGISPVNTNTNVNPAPEPQGKESVKKLQQILIDEGLLQATYISAASGTAISSADGIWGKASATALAKFQKKYGLGITGKPDAETVNFIKNMNRKEETNVPEVQAGSGFYPCFN